MRALLALVLIAGCARPARAPHMDADMLEPLRWSSSSAYDADGARRMIGGCATDCAAVVSYRVPPQHALYRELGGRSFVYDNALAMLVHLNEGRPESALSIGRTLVALRNADRTIGFSFDFADPAFVDSGYVRAGVVAWAGYALATYDRVTGTNTFADVARSFADGLLAARFGPNDGSRAGLVAAGRGRWLEDSTIFDGRFVADYAVTEHQIDVYFLLRALDELDPGSSYGLAAATLARDIVRAAWIEDEGMFATGVDRDGPSDEFALDSGGAWGALFLLAIGDHARAHRSAVETDRNFARVINGNPGYAPYLGPVPDSAGRDLSHTFFSEGTASMGVLFARLHGKKRAHEVASVLAELRRDGAVPYAFPASPDFPDLPAIAPTAWLRLLERELATSRPFVFAAPRIDP